jgi:hypothetical protein
MALDPGVLGAHVVVARQALAEAGVQGGEEIRRWMERSVHGGTLGLIASDAVRRLSGANYAPGRRRCESEGRSDLDIARV